MQDQNNTVTPLTDRPVPVMVGDQISKFTWDSIHVDEAGEFDQAKSQEKLTQLEGQKVLGADFGGDKGITKLFIVRDGGLVISDEYEDYVQSNNGDGYLQSLEKTADFARSQNIPVGISWGGPLDGTKPVFHPKATHFFEEFEDQYQRDFKNVLETLTACVNDGVAGLIAGAAKAYKDLKTTNVLFVINGGGLNTAILKNGKLYSTESGHVEGLAELNTYGQTTPCGVFENQYICIERLGANKAGIEAQWLEKTGEYLRAREIEDRYKAGDAFAGELYDHAAWVSSHLVQGVANAFELDLFNGSTVVVGHGGAFKFPHFGGRIVQVLSTQSQGVQLLMTKDFTDERSNACLDGAALAALYAI